MLTLLVPKGITSMQRLRPEQQENKFLSPASPWSGAGFSASLFLCGCGCHMLVEPMHAVTRTIDSRYLPADAPGRDTHFLRAGGGRWEGAASVTL